MTISGFLYFDLHVLLCKLKMISHGYRLGCAERKLVSYQLLLLDFERKNPDQNWPKQKSGTCIFSGKVEL